MNFSLSAIIASLAFVLSINAFADTLAQFVVPLQQYSDPDYRDPFQYYSSRYKDDEWTNPKQYKIHNFFTNVVYSQDRIVVTASLIYKKGGSEGDIFYHGSFSPTAAAYFKPFYKSRVRPFVMASCLDYFCNSIVVGLGIKTDAGNPYAYVEPKFVLTRRNYRGI